MASITSPQSSSLMLSASPPEYKDSVGTGGAKYHVVVDLVLRVMLFATALVAIVVVATSNQTKIPSLNAGGLQEPATAKFNDSPAFIYYVTALSVASLYSIITGVLSVIALTKAKGRTTEKVLLFIVLDGLVLIIMASATGAAGAISYQGIIGDTKRHSELLRHVRFILSSHSRFCFSVNLTLCSTCAATLALRYRALNEDG